jgi:site-specific DNA-adenine methylase
MTAPTINSIASWFGGNRVLAREAGKHLGRLRWCGVPFCGGCAELQYIDTVSGVASDLHRHVINLAVVIRDDVMREVLIKRLGATLFHPDELNWCRALCRDREVGEGGSLFRPKPSDGIPDMEWAYSYFVSVWMGAGGIAGKATEFNGGISTRWTSSGGDSAKRFRSAADSLDAWARIMRPWCFEVCDAFTFLDRVKDDEGHGLYLDPPWSDAGLEYKHPFSLDQIRRVASSLSRFERARIVVRFGDHPLVRELFPAGLWTWIENKSTNQQGNEVREVLLVRGGAP